MSKKLALLSLPILAAAAIAVPSQAQTIAGPSQVQAQTAGTTVVNGSTRFPLSQITDGVTSDAAQYNGFQGRNSPSTGWNGVINLKLNTSYDIDRFHLWNDINVRMEGLKDFTLRFYDSNNAVVHTQRFTAKGGMVDMQTFMLSTTARCAARVELLVNSVQAERNTYARRVEIREVAFSGVRSGEGRKCCNSKANPSKLDERVRERPKPRQQRRR